MLVDLNSEYSITQLQALFESGTVTSASYCQSLVDRICEIDQSGPTLRSVVEISPEWYRIASALDEERRTEGPRGPLHGVPIVVKDSIDTADGMATANGSLALINNFATTDAFHVAKLREAGAVILGKTNQSEWGYMRNFPGCSGWSSRGGQTKNPYVLDRSPVGSSSGSGVAPAANLCIAAIGAEVDGSVVLPAAANSIVGLKPTVGLVSRSGCMGIAPTQDTIGPMTRSVEDAAILLNTLVGYDEADPITASGAEAAPADYCSYLHANALQGARIGVARECFSTHHQTNAMMEEAIATLQKLGATIVDPVQSSTLPFFGDYELELFQMGVNYNINRYLKENPNAGPKDIKDIIDFNRRHADVVMPYFQQGNLEKCASKPNVARLEDDDHYNEIVAELGKLSRDEGIDKALQEHNLDAIIAPTMPTPSWVIDPVVGDNIQVGVGAGWSCTAPAISGYPHITVPAGYVHKELPIGLSFYSTRYTEPQLLGYAYAFEQATKARKRPQFLPTLTE